MVKTFSNGEVLKFGWNTLKRNLGFFVIILLVVWFISFFPHIVNKFTGNQKSLAMVILYLIFFIFELVMIMGLMRISLKFCDNEKARVSDLFSCFHLFFKCFFGSILYLLIVLGGTILLIIPGIIWGIKFALFLYFIVDKGMGPVEALGKSAEVTYGAKWDLLGFNILTSLLMTPLLLMVYFLMLVAIPTVCSAPFLSFCILTGFAIIIAIVYYFATMPAIMVAHAFVYRKLLVQTETQTA